MKVRLSELDCATREALSSLDVSTLPDVARVFMATDADDPEMSFRQAAHAVAGAVLIAALPDLPPAAAPEVASNMKLSHIRIDGGDPTGDPIFLPAGAVAEHPLFATWVGQDIIGAVEHLLKAGAIWSQLAPSAPYFEELQITDYGGSLLGIHKRLSFAKGDGTAMVVTAAYGAAGTEVAVSRTLAIKAASFIRIGGVPLTDATARADEAAMDSALRAAAQAVGAAVLH